MELIPDLSAPPSVETEPEPVLPMGDHLTALQLLQAIYRNPNLPLTVRHRAARDALPYEAPKLAVVANVSESFGDQLEAAIRKRMANYKERPAQKVIDGKATEIKPLVRRI
jgi:hypothetical protein